MAIARAGAAETLTPGVDPLGIAEIERRLFVGPCDGGKTGYAKT
jgi:hypothetical protein